MTTTDRFSPNWKSPPGDSIAAVLAGRGQSVDDFAAMIQCTAVMAKKIISGATPITAPLAKSLTKHIGATVDFWISRESEYRSGLEQYLTRRMDEWMRSLPLKDMTNYGWISPSSKSGPEMIAACLSFFGISDFVEWDTKYRSLLYSTALRTSASFDEQIEPLAAWIQRGVILSERIKCAPWDKDGFRKSLPDLRALTNEKDPAVFVPKITEICASSGVAFLLLRAPAGCRASGATKFLDDGKAFLMLSLRHLSEDHFWFSLFHEAAHLLLHGSDLTFIEGSVSADSPEEQEANQFASDTLVPRDYKHYLASVPREMKEIMRLARRLGISAGVLVGQLQSIGRVPYNHFNGLKRRFKWDEMKPSRR